MTREELKRHCLKLVEDCEILASYNGEEPHGKIYEKHKLILELLEQQPCKDCISREQALEAIDTWDKFGDVPQYGLMRISVYDKTYIPYVKYNDIVECIKYLPPVITKQKVGKWIDDNCSICGYGVNLWNKTPYCPNCGAKMTESEGEI